MRGDGTLVLAGQHVSAVLDPQTFASIATLPGAVKVSADGERLLVRQPDERMGRVRSRDGAILPTAALTLPYGDEWLQGVSRDFEWAATENGNVILNLSTGVRIDTSGDA